MSPLSLVLLRNALVFAAILSDWKVNVTERQCSFKTAIAKRLRLMGKVMAKAKRLVMEIQ